MKAFTAEEIDSISSVMMRFDFQKVHDYMTSVDWKWRDEVPSMEELRFTAARLLGEAVEDPQEVVSMGTGGFRVYKLPWGLELVFAMERRGNF
ncbi:hypothetical protein UFOVP699_173 [uncultured Caudovirales phage]|uniref:Uncharacterized protein n=1 Tax=uncultured Caudovirales phage TaxID=2100421 RepID=A0A6J5NKS2_9CAUD|nr:hypothetical protein UFOVP699_173 [uncultured Caudovirales phage]